MFVYKISFFVSFPGLVAQSCLTLQPHELKPVRLLCPWVFPGKNAGVSCHFLLQGIFLTQRPNPCLLHWQMASLPLSHQGSLESSNFLILASEPSSSKSHIINKQTNKKSIHDSGESKGLRSLYVRNQRMVLGPSCWSSG